MLTRYAGRQNQLQTNLFKRQSLSYELLFGAELDFPDTSKLYKSLKTKGLSEIELEMKVIKRDCVH